MSSYTIDCARLLKNLGDHTRLCVVKKLMHGPCQFSLLCEYMALEPNLLSHHLKILKNLNLIKSERIGKHVLYQLEDGVLMQIGIINLGCCSLDFGVDDGSGSTVLDKDSAANSF